MLLKNKTQKKRTKIESFSKTGIYSFKFSIFIHRLQKVVAYRKLHKHCMYHKGKKPNK